MMAENTSKVEFRKNLIAYLSELKMLTGTEVDCESLSSLEEVEKVRQEASILSSANQSRLTINFDEKSSEKFRKFVSRLSQSNGSPVYIWTPRTNSCGLHKVSSVEAINFSFPFDINPEGIIVVLTEDLCDKLLLDFSYDSEEREILEIELQGEHWPLIRYESEESFPER